MPRPNKPHWHARNRCWRSTVAGRVVDFRPGLVPGFDRPIGRDEKPLVEGIPKRAWDVLHQYKDLLDAARVDVRNPTVEAVADLYLQHAAAERDAGRITAANYRGHECHLSKFADWTPPGSVRALGDFLCSDLDPSVLERFAKEMAGSHSPHYVANLCRSVQACLNWAATRVKGRDPERYVAENPVKGYRPPKPPKSAHKYLDAGDLRAFLRWAWSRARVSPGVQRDFDLVFVRMLWFLALTGARPGEACGLRWAGVDYARGIATLTEWKNKRKTGRDREIHLTPGVARLLRALGRREGRHPVWVFTHSLGRGQAGLASRAEGMPWDSVALAAKVRHWRAAARAAGLAVVEKGAGRLVAYMLRHTYISDGLMGGLSEAEVADLAGTSAQMVADVYGHIQRGHAARRAGELAERRRGKSG